LLHQKVKQFISVAASNQPMRRYVMERTPHCEGPKAQVARSNRAGQAKIAKTLELPWSIAAN